jgi:N-acetylmuramoyl-L-alanine amidase
VKPDMVLDIHVGADPDNERYLGTTVWYNSAFYSEKMTNVRLADIMEKNLVTAISGKANGIMADTEGKYPLLKMLSVPAVSVELGYLTNAQESALLDQEEYLEKIAQGLYQGILAVREEMK